MKLAHTWATITNPLGYDPYNSVVNGYVVNTATFELREFKNHLTNHLTAEAIQQSRLRAEVALAGLSEPARPMTAKPFSLEDPLP